MTSVGECTWKEMSATAEYTSVEASWVASLGWCLAQARHRVIA